MPTRVFAVLVSFVFALALLSPAAARSNPNTPHVVVSDNRPYSFDVSWATANPSKGKVEVQLATKWTNVPDVGGSPTTHLFVVPCSNQNKCKLKPSTLYPLRVSGAGIRSMTFHVRTSPTLSPVVPMAAVGGHVFGTNHKPLAHALVYVTLRYSGATSVPLVALTLPNGGWIVALANAVTSKKTNFPLKTGEQVTIHVVTGRGSAIQVVKLISLQQPMLLKHPIVVR